MCEFEYKELIVDCCSNGKRLDVFLSMEMAKTRSYIKTLLTKELITVDDNSCKAGYIVKTGQKIIVKNPILNDCNIVAIDIPISIIYQDQHIVVVNKPIGLTVHPSNGHQSDTLVNALLYCVDELSSINGIARPGIVHRLDKETSGVIVVAKTDVAHLKLSKQFEERSVKKIYFGVVEGYLSKENGTINLPIARDKIDRKKMSVSMGGKLATTNYRVIKKLKKSTLVEFEILTGRTHQIRVHAKYLGNPIVGDCIYGSLKQSHKQLLHSYSITLRHPINDNIVNFRAPLPDYFIKFLHDQRINV